MWRSLHPGWLLAAMLFFSLLLILGSVPGQAHALSVRFGDKLLHMLAYALLTFLCYRAITTTKMLRALITLLMIAILGLLDEAGQSFLPYRNASMLDWWFDMAAACIVVTLLSLRS
jgi:VanZ family protein